MEDAPLSPSLDVRGHACEVFDEPATAWTLHQETHLIRWRGAAAGPLVDRFDARNLLEERAQFRRLKQRPVKRKRDGAGADAEDAAPGAELSALLRRLRYADYAVEFPDADAEDTAAVENRFPYRYPDDAGGDSGEEEDESDGEPFTPTFRVPDGVTVPATAKRHAIVKATADRVRGNAPLEVLMKARLGGDPRFAFLRPDGRLSAYYCFLRDKNPREGSLLLGAEYADSDDEDEDEDEDEDASKQTPSST